MNRDLRLPQNNKEGLLYGVIICGITALSMSSFNIYLQFRSVTPEFIFTISKGFPIFFLIAMIMENFVVGPLANKMVAKYTSEADSFNAQILFSVFFTVLGMSFLMTFIGDFIGHGCVVNLSTLPRFFSAWPRNFSLVFMLELLIAQPVARKVMSTLHQKK